MSVTDRPTSTPPSDPAAAPVTYGWPTWIRRTIISVALVACAGLLVWGNSHSDAGKTPKDRDPAIVAQSPAPGTTGGRTDSVGADLRLGYDGRLTINGTAIPEDQMDGALDPKTMDPKTLKQLGVRPNNRNHVFFTPGPGKVITRLPEGTVYVILTYFLDRRNHATGRSITWTYNAI